MARITIAADTDFAGYVDRRMVQTKDFTVGFADLGAGATDSILLSAMEFEGSLPTNIFMLGAGFIANPEFTGEADLTVALGFEGGDTDGLITATVLHETGDNVTIDTVAGALAAPRVRTALTTVAALFAATELNDVTAGSLTIRLYYLNAFPA